MSGGGNYVDRNAIALVPTPAGTESWKPVPHMEVIDAVTDVVKAHSWQILDENFGLAREGQKMFGVMRINKSNSSDWSRCIGLRNSHAKEFTLLLPVIGKSVQYLGQRHAFGSFAAHYCSDDIRSKVDQ